MSAHPGLNLRHGSLTLDMRLMCPHVKKMDLGLTHLQKLAHELRICPKPWRKTRAILPINVGSLSKSMGLRLRYIMQVSLS